MKKLLLFSGLALSLVAVKAQNSIVYEDFNKHRLNYWTSNKDASGADVYMYTTENPAKDAVNMTDSVGRFDRKAGVPASKWVVVSAGPDGAGGNWGTYDMATYPILSMDVMAADSFQMRILVKDKVSPGNPDLEWKDFTYEKEDKGKWKKLVADFSNRAAADWPSIIELQLFFSYGVAKDITIYYDNVAGAKSIGDVQTGLSAVKSTSFEVKQNVPNPASDITNIGYSLKEANAVSLNVYDILGNQVVSLINEKQVPGSYLMPLDVSGFQAGLYYYTLKVGGSAVTKKIQVIR